MFEEVICSICHDTTSRSYKSCCGQYYHIECLFTWLKTHNKCPICKVRLSSYILEVMDTWRQSKTEKERNQIRWQLMICDERDFCSVCYKKVDGNTAVCNGYKYHVDCIKNRKECPECKLELTNRTIFRMYLASHKKNIFDSSNYLDHIIQSRTIVKAHRGGVSAHLDNSCIARRRRETIRHRRRRRSSHYGYEIEHDEYRLESSDDELPILRNDIPPIVGVGIHPTIDDFAVRLPGIIHGDSTESDPDSMPDLENNIMQSDTSISSME
jgi:predicted Zn-ribbon and HTH transcriptional regulator